MASFGMANLFLFSTMQRVFLNGYICMMHTPLRTQKKVITSERKDLLGGNWTSCGNHFIILYVQISSRYLLHMKLK